MLTSIIKATRAHYAALQHKPSADRVALDYEVLQTSGIPDTDVIVLSRGSVWVKVDHPTIGYRPKAWARQKAEMTKLRNRLTAMYPEANQISVEYRKTEKLPTANAPKALWTEKPIRNVTANVQCVRCGQIGVGPCGCGFQQPAKTWKPQVKVQGEWAGNALVFATEREAYENAKSLFGRWTLCEDYRAVESTEAVNYSWVDGQLILKGPQS